MLKNFLLVGMCNQKSLETTALDSFKYVNINYIR